VNTRSAASKLEPNGYGAKQTNRKYRNICFLDEDHFNLRITTTPTGITTRYTLMYTVRHNTTTLFCVFVTRPLNYIISFGGLLVAGAFACAYAQRCRWNARKMQRYCRLRIRAELL